MTFHCRHSRIVLLGAPFGDGAARSGARFGPGALRSAGLARALEREGRAVADLGDLRCLDFRAEDSALLSGNARNAEKVAGAARELSRAVRDILGNGDLPLVMGGDHSLSMGSVNGAAWHWAARGRAFFLLWLDAHADYNTPAISPSGNMHGMALAMLAGEDGFDLLLGDEPRQSVTKENITLLGTRALDRGEADLISRAGISMLNMHELRACGPRGALRPLLDRVARQGGVLHVSLDVDFLDPAVAPGVGTPEPGGASAAEAALIMEMLRESGLVRSLDVVELNPLHDRAGMSAGAAIALAATLLGGSTALATPAGPECHHGQDAA